MEAMRRFLNERARAQNLRVLSPSDRRRPGTVEKDGREYVDFSSNDYLGFSGHPRLVNAAAGALAAFGVGAGASRLMSGDLTIHHELETMTASFKRKEAALVFNSGYQANTGIIPAMVGRTGVVFADRLCHASIFDGAVLSRAKLFRFNHNDVTHLLDLLRRHRRDFERALVVTESVFSMDGDLAPLAEIVEAKERHDSMLLVDEAHATGVFGNEGRGLVEREGLTGRVDMVVGTFSKALGGFGAYVAASADVVQYLVNASRSFIYSTALPPAIIAADIEALRMCLEGLAGGPELLAKADRLRTALAAQGWVVSGSSQIVPVIAGESERAVSISRRLLLRGLHVVAIRPPTVPEGRSRLRLSLTSAHTDEHLLCLVEAFRELA